MQDLHYFPGHMKKTQRAIEESIKKVDAVCEILDARIPLSSRNPDIDSLTAGKPRLIVLNHTDQADSAKTKLWAAYFRGKGMTVVATDCKSRKGIGDFDPAVRLACKEKLDRDAAKGMNRPVRVMVVGIPNVGKSTLINQISGRKGAKAENRPGVTRGKQWVTVNAGLQLLDTPGILWPKFEDPQVGMMLAYTGAVKEDILDVEELAVRLMELLWQRYPQAVKDRYGIDMPEDAAGYELLTEAGRKRGYLLARGEINTERMARMLLDEFRGAKLGRFTLELPEEEKHE